MSVGPTGNPDRDDFAVVEAQVCYYCNTPLDPQYDYACIHCGKESCDYDNQACQEEDCDDISCFLCVDFHLQTCHPE